MTWAVNERTPVVNQEAHLDAIPMISQDLKRTRYLALLILANMHQVKCIAARRLGGNSFWDTLMRSLRKFPPSSERLREIYCRDLGGSFSTLQFLGLQKERLSLLDLILALVFSAVFLFPLLLRESFPPDLWEHISHCNRIMPEGDVHVGHVTEATISSV